MTISELISKLEEIRRTQGDIRVVTPGFDETDYDDVESLDLVELKFGTVRKNSHGALHEEQTGGTIALSINF